MTTDDFTTAARAEAERQARVAHPPIITASGTRIDSDESIAYRRGGERMAVWARDHLAAQEPTDDEVRAVIEAVELGQHQHLRYSSERIASCPGGGDTSEWRRKWPYRDERSFTVPLVRAALVAARAVRQEKR